MPTRNTTKKTALFHAKKLDVMCDLFVRSVFAGQNMGFPTARDSAIASEVAWAMLNDAVKDQPPSVGTPSEIKMILEHRRSLRSVVDQAMAGLERDPGVAALDASYQKAFGLISSTKLREAFDLGRACACRLGALLAAEGTLERPEDVFS